MKDLRSVKGTRDYFGDEQKKRRVVKEKIRNIFLKYNYAEVETSALEYLNVLEQKDALGDDNVKDVFRIDGGGENPVGLRFDMTTPIARVVATDKRMQKPIKWFYITNVWRHENTQKGRLREFWQFGIEHIGDKFSVLADAENLIIIDEICEVLGVKNYRFKINSRENLVSISKHFGIKDTKSFCSALDKKNKMKPEEWREQISVFLESDAHVDELMSLFDSQSSTTSEIKQSCIGAMDEIIDVCSLAGMNKDIIEIDLSLARGLDYYTGMIFEMDVADSNVGSIVAGGRYDNLIKAMGGEDTSATGFSGGLERLFEVIGDVNMETTKKVLIIADAIDNQKYTVCTRKALFDIVQNFQVEIYHALDVKKGLEYADKNNFEYCLFILQEDSSSRGMRLRDMSTRKEVKFYQMEELKNLLK